MSTIRLSSLIRNTMCANQAHPTSRGALLKSGIASLGATFCWQAVFLLLCGCGGGGPQKFSISGHVTYDGQPVTNGSVSLTPVDTSTGKGVGTDLIDGHYEFEREHGPVQGKYVVRIEAQRPSGKKIPSEDGSPPLDQLIQYIPAAYNVQSNLEVEITADRDDLDFQLEKVAAPRRR